MVVAGATCLALAISRSYFEWGGSPSGPIAAMLPMSPSSNMTSSITPIRRRAATRKSRCFRLCLFPGRRDDREVWNRGRCLLDPERAGDSQHAFLVLGRELAARAHDLLDELIRLASRIGVGRKHRGKGGERGFGIDQQEIELLAHERFEGRQGNVAIRAANAAHSFETAFIDRRASRAHIEERANDRFPQPADRNARLELGNALLQEFVMQWALGRLPQGTRPGRIDAGGGLQRL